MNSQHIIARYSAWKALPATIGPILGLLLIYIVPLIYKEGPLTILRSGRSYAPFVVIGWFVAPFYIFMLLRIVVRILLRNRMAVWHDGDKIHYMDSRPKSLDRRDIVSINVASFRFWGFDIPFIGLTLRDGSEHRIPNWPLADPADLVAARLKAAA